MSYEITVFRRPEWSDYVDFVARHHRDPSHGTADERHKWRVFDNPHDGYFLFAHTGDEIAATLTLSKRHLYTPDGPLPCYELGDGWTSENHRRRGLFHMLGGRARDLVFGETPVELIIGAPNPAAVPNWTKHGYVFTKPDGTMLLLRPSLPGQLRLRARRLAGLPPQAVEPVAAMTEQRAPLLRATLRELPFSEYAARTADFPRMNFAVPGYLDWRFGRSPDGYRHFSARQPGGELLCALRVSHLGPMPVLVASESFLADGTRPGRRELSLLPAIARRYYRGHAGIYVNAKVDPGIQRYLLLGRHRFVVHRHQHVCYLWKGGPTEERRALMEAMRARFQLSDVDVG